MFLFCSLSLLLSLLSVTDTAAKLAGTKAVAADANATAVDVLERLGDLNLRLRGLQRNYSELEDTVNAANQMIQDPEKNSTVIFILAGYVMIVDRPVRISIKDNENQM